MNSKRRISLIEYLLIISLLSSLTNIIYAQNRQGAYDYETDEWNSAYNQNVYASLNGKIRELVSADNGADADDTDTRFQPPRDNNNAHKSSVGEGYRIADSDDIIPSISVPVVNENILQRHARAVTWNVNSLQLTTVDGSGEIEDGSTSEATTEITQTTITVELTSTDITNNSTVTSQQTESPSTEQSGTSASSSTQTGIITSLYSTIANTAETDVFSSVSTESARTDASTSINIIQTSTVTGSDITEELTSARTVPTSATTDVDATEATSIEMTTEGFESTSASSNITVRTTSEMITSEPTSTSTTITTTESSTAAEETSIFTTMIRSTTEATTTVITTTSTTTIATTTTTTRPRNCAWTTWVPLTNCTPDCGDAYRIVIRSCIDSVSSQSCDSSLCGGGNALQNETCSTSPPCETLTVIPPTNTRDSGIRMVSYPLPDSMYFFGQTYRRIWISSKGYISFGTDYYSRTMTSTNFRQINNQAIIAPFWADMIYNSSVSTLTINWFSSTDGSVNSSLSEYYSIVRSVVNAACPTTSCPLDFAAARVVRVNWDKLIYQVPYLSQSISLSFSAYLINTYEYSYYSYPILRSYIAFDYSNLTNNLAGLKPFVGYRGTTGNTQIFNDPLNNQNAAFLTQRGRRNFYVGGRFLTDCEVSFLQETRVNTLNPTGNLNDELNNPRFPCPCTLGQALADNRFGPLSSETYYEAMQGIICYAPRVIAWTYRFWSTGWDWRMMRSQSCCYSWYTWSLITSGPLAGSVLSDPYLLFWPYAWQRRISFHDQCCSPSYINGYPDWNTCQFYYQLHPASTCNGYRPPAIVTFNGDPHITTIDNGRYTCHVQGLFVFAQTTETARIRAEYNFLNVSGDLDLIYPDDLFKVYVRSKYVAPALSYIERTKGYGSIFTSYSIIALNYTFEISNDNGQFSCTINDISLSDDLANNLNYEYTNANLTDTSAQNTERYIYRLQQTTRELGNVTVPQLILTIWSGLSIQFEIIGENLECSLTLPQKFREQIEGLAGNFNGDYSDDLIEQNTGNITTISTVVNRTFFNNDAEVLNACRSWRVPGDTTPDNSTPIMPTEFVQWYYNNASDILAQLNPLLSQTVVNQTCNGNFECIHDYLIRINKFTSSATASLMDSAQASKLTLAAIPPIINISLNIEIHIPVSDGDRNYTLPINITGATNIIVTVSINGTQRNTTIINAAIIIPLPDTTNNYVEVLLTIEYGTNFIMTQYLEIFACLCANNGTCNFAQTTAISTHYSLASCNCPDTYEGDLCQNPYNACTSGSACQLNWNNDTECIPLNATEQSRLGHSYYCNGSCISGYETEDNFTCIDIDECTANTHSCQNGNCSNLIGSYTCNCFAGYRLSGQTCVDIDECTEPNSDGSFPRRCNETEMCINTNGSYNCSCPTSYVNGTCSGSCVDDTCTVGNHTVCIRGTVNVNGSCLPWCRDKCSNFCERINDNFECNCGKYPGYQRSIDGQSCLPCGDGSYGYNCNQSCECVLGTCNKNATSVTASCSCFSGYEGVVCSRLTDSCLNNGPCNNVTENCETNANNGTAICTCKLGYERNTTNGLCTNINECTAGTSTCNIASSYCSDNDGGYDCVCRSGYLKNTNNVCEDIDECQNSSACINYANTYCTNLPGSYECRCTSGYSINGENTDVSQNVLNTNNTCIRKDLSLLCVNSCSYPSTCNTDGNCTCPIAVPIIGFTSDNLKETCLCPGDPYVIYNNVSCVLQNKTSSTTWLTMYLNLNALNLRTIDLNSPISSTRTEIAEILNNMGLNVNQSTILVSNLSSSTDTRTGLLVDLGMFLTSTQRINLTAQLFQRNRELSDAGGLEIQMIINDNTYEPKSFTSEPRLCEACVYSDTGACSTNDNATCRCFNGYTGRLCDETESVLNSESPSSDWTVAVAVISAVAGLLLLIVLVMVICYCISKCRQSSSSSPKLMREPVFRDSYYIPRAHMPTMGTMAQNNRYSDGFSITTNDNQNNDESGGSYPSRSSTTHNPAYHSYTSHQQPIFDIFTDLERQRAVGRRSIPSKQMRDMSSTLNSFPPNPFDDTIGRTNSYHRPRDVNEIEFVTDMLDDMTRDDDIEDGFIEALNPNVIVPTTTTSQANNRGWFSFFRDM